MFKPPDRTKVKTPQDVAKHQGRDFRVPDGDEMTVTPDTPDVFPVEVRTFQDLQTLNFIPPQLQEAATRAAIAADNAAALVLAQGILQNRPAGGSSCGCDDAHTSTLSSLAAFRPVNRDLMTAAVPASALELPPKTTFAQDLAVTYNGIRKSLNTQLAGLLEAATQREVRFDSRLAGIARGWINRVDLFGRIPVGVFRPRDVVIGRNATLFLNPDVTSLRANNIQIHVGGRLIVQSGYVKIVCASMRGAIP